MRTKNKVVLFCLLEVYFVVVVVSGQCTSQWCEEDGAQREIKMEDLLHYMNAQFEVLKQEMLSEIKEAKANCAKCLEECKPLVGDGYILSHDGYTYMIPEDKRTWEDARQDCLSRGFDLAYFGSVAEHEHIISVLRANPSLSSETNYFVGGTDQGHEGCWIWTAPQIKQIPAGQKWGSGEPNDNVGNENCLNLHFDPPDNHYYTLNDYPCSELTRYICKRVTGRPVTNIVSREEYLNTDICK